MNPGIPQKAIVMYLQCLKSQYKTPTRIPDPANAIYRAIEYDCLL